MKKLRYTLFFLLFLLLTASCALPAVQEEPAEGTPIYYLASGDTVRGADKLQISHENLDLPSGATLTDRASAVVRRLLEEPSDEHLHSPMPGVRLLHLDIADRCAYVDLSGEFARLHGIDLTLADYCLTLSLTGLDGIEAVAITAMGNNLGQQPKQIFFERDVRLSTMDDVYKTVDVTLYFPSGDSTLVAEERTLLLYEGQTVAEIIIDALADGPQNPSLLPIIPDGFTIYSIRVDNGVCTLSLSADALLSLPQEEMSQQMILWSIAYSLYSADSIQALRIMADGEILTHFGLVPMDLVSVKSQNQA